MPALAPAPCYSLLLLVALVTTASATEITTDRNPSDRAAASTERVVMTAPGVEIRADERGVYRKVFKPVSPTVENVHLPEVFATTGTTSVTSPAWRPLPLYGGVPTDIAASPIDPDYVLAGLEEGPASGALFESTDGGTTWSAVPNVFGLPYLGWVTDLEFDSNGKAYVAFERTVVTRDPVGNWAVFRHTPYESVSEIGLNPSNPEEVWLAGYAQFTGRRQVLRSRDGGLTWVNVGLDTGDMGCTGIAFKTSDSRIVVATFSFNGGQLWRSGDGGDTWTREATLVSNYTDVVYDGERFFASGEWNNTAGVFASSDDGLTWGRINNGYWPSNQVYDLDTDPREPGALLAMTLGGPVLCREGLWTYRPGNVHKETRAGCLFPGDPNRILVGQNGEGFLRSTDGGATFMTSSTGLLATDVHSVAVNPVDANKIAAAFQSMNGGGVYFSTDGGLTWLIQDLPPARYDAVTFASDGTLYVSQRGPTSHTAPEGVYRRNANGRWTPLGPFVGTLFETDVMGIVTDPANPRVIFLVGQTWPGVSYGIWRSTDAGAHWTRVHTAPTDFTYRSAIRIIQDGTGSRLLATAPFVGAFYSSDRGDSWTPAGLPNNTRGSYLRGTPADPNTFYLLGYMSIGYRTKDGGKSWTSFRVGGEGFTSLEVDRTNPDTFYVTRLGNPVLMRSVNGGATFEPFDEGCPRQFGNDFTWSSAPCPTLLHANRAGVFVREIDSAAPQVSLELEPSVLWPPDHKMRTIHARVVTSDGCDANPSFALSSITVEDETGAPQDIAAEIGAATTTFQLRAERPGKGERRYLVTYTATDASGNVSTATATVRVPHDMSEARPSDGAGRTTVPAKTELVSIQPNPFNPSTSAMIALAMAQDVSLDVYDVRGARVRTLASGTMPAGSHRIAWDGLDDTGVPSASGVYFFRFTAGSHVQTMKALLIK